MPKPNYMAHGGRGYDTKERFYNAGEGLKMNDMHTAHNQIVRLERKLQWLAGMGGEQWDLQDGDKLERKLSDMRAEYERKYIMYV